MNEIGPDKIMDHASQLLSFDNKFYNVSKKLFDYNEYTEIAKKLFQVKNHQFGGMVSAIAVFTLGLTILGHLEFHFRGKLIRHYQSVRLKNLEGDEALDG